MTDPTFRPGEQMVLVLVSLASGPKHGHAILTDVRSFAGVDLGPGTLYGAISRLEEAGLIEGLEAEGRRRPYRLTPHGTDALRARLGELEIAVRTGRGRLTEGEP